MKTLLISCMCLVAVYAAAQHDLTVKITGITKTTGSSEICVYEEGDGFMNTDKATSCAWLAVDAEVVSHTFEGLKPGRYAVIVIHDLNGNKSLDTNLFRIPKEPYGFSTNPSTTFGPPDFDGASFALSSDLEIEIKLK